MERPGPLIIQPKNSVYFTPSGRESFNGRILIDCAGCEYRRLGFTFACHQGCVFVKVSRPCRSGDSIGR